MNVESDEELIIIVSFSLFNVAHDGQFSRSVLQGKDQILINRITVPANLSSRSDWVRYPFDDQITICWLSLSYRKDQKLINDVRTTLMGNKFDP